MADRVMAVRFLPQYARRKAITFRFATLSSELVGVPLAVMRSSDPELAAAARIDGADLRFTSADGTSLLGHELEHYDAASGALVAWVRVPRLPAGGATTIYLYYGASAPAPTDPSAVWVGSAGVWHLGESLVAAGDAAKDSTGRGHHALTLAAGQAPTRVAGIAGFAQLYDGDDTLRIGDPADGSLDFGTASFSYSAWVKVAAPAGATDSPWYKGGSSGVNAGYDLELGADTWMAGLSDGTSNLNGPFGLASEFLDRWVHLAAVVDRENAKFRVFADGTQREARDLTSLGSLSTALGADIGRPQAGSWFRGMVDEVRVSAGAWSADLVAAQYQNLAAHDQCVTVGPEERAPPP